MNVLFFLKDRDGGWHAPLSGLGEWSFTTTREKTSNLTANNMMQAAIGGLCKADEKTFLAWKEVAESEQPVPIRIAVFWPHGTKMIEGNFHISMPNRRWKKIEIKSAGEVIPSWDPAV